MEEAVRRKEDRENEGKDIFILSVIIYSISSGGDN